jgi:hypothetical protein
MADAASTGPAAQGTSQIMVHGLEIVLPGLIMGSTFVHSFSEPNTRITKAGKFLFLTFLAWMVIYFAWGAPGGQLAIQILFVT